MATENAPGRPNVPQSLDMRLKLAQEEDGPVNDAASAVAGAASGDGESDALVTSGLGGR